MSREVLILDDDADLRASLGEILSDVCNRAWIDASSVAEVIALGPRALACELAILDINLGPNQPSGLDAYGWLMAHGFAGRIVFLTGHAQAHPLIERARSLPTVRVCVKPIPFDVVSSLLEEG